MFAAVDVRHPPPPPPSSHHCRSFASTSAGGLGNDEYTLKPSQPPPAERVDPGARGLFEQNDDRLSLYTEAIGCESCEMWLDDAEIAAAVTATAEEGGDGRRRRSRSGRCSGEQARFPPPMPLRSKFLRVERKEGRIVLTEVRIERPEIFRAYREDGRLRLELICPADADDEAGDGMAAAVEEEEQEERREEVEIGRERRREGFRQCFPAVGGNRPPLWWSHRFVTTA